jgi:hypothetical protein
MIGLQLKNPPPKESVSAGFMEVILNIPELYEVVAG